MAAGKRPPTAEERALIHFDPPSKRFALSAMAYLVAGTAAGTLHPWLSSSFSLKAHIHLLTLGFFSFLIYGLAYHMFPRFLGSRMPWSWRTRAHEILAHLGLWVMTGGWLADDLTITGVGAIISWVSFLLFAWALWPVFQRAKPAA